MFRTGDHILENEREHIEALVHELSDRAEKLGLYAQEMTIAAADEEAAEAVQHTKSIREAIKAGARFVVVGTFIIGEQAYSNRVQNPEQYEVDKASSVMIAELNPADSLKDDMLDKLKDGDILGIFDVDKPNPDDDQH